MHCLNFGLCQLKMEYQKVRARSENKAGIIKKSSDEFTHFLLSFGDALISLKCAINQSSWCVLEGDCKKRHVLCASISILVTDADEGAFAMHFFAPLAAVLI